MKKAIIILAISLSFINNVKAQSPRADSLKTKSYQSNHFAVGMNINHFGNDFGIGLNVTSPYFSGGAVAIRASENYQWFSYIDKTGTNVWAGYHNIRVGVLGGNFMLNKSIRLYGEGGVTFLIGNSSFTSQSMVVGGYGLFGFEFFISKGFSYFIEMGGIGTGASADKIAGKPIYSNGFLSSVGFRINL